VASTNRPTQWLGAANIQKILDSAKNMGPSKARTGRAPCATPEGHSVIKSVTRQPDADTGLPHDGFRGKKRSWKALKPKRW
jgi:hypothetical protein